MRHAKGADSRHEIAAFMTAVDEEGAVYVHCVGGRHRTGVMTAVYRMMKDGLTADQAFKEMKHNKDGPDFLHPEFKKFVYKFEPKAAGGSRRNCSAVNKDLSLADRDQMIAGAEEQRALRDRRRGHRHFAERVGRQQLVRRPRLHHIHIAVFAREVHRPSAATAEAVKPVLPSPSRAW